MQQHNIGIIQAIISAILWGLVYFLDERILTKVSPTILMMAGCIIQGLILLFVIPKATYAEVTKLSNNELGIILFTMVVATGASFLALSGIKKVDAATISIIEIAYPVFVVLFGFLFYSRMPNIYFFIGGALVFAGSYVIIKYA